MSGEGNFRWVIPDGWLPPKGGTGDMSNLIDKFWLWGQSPGTHHEVNGGNPYKLPGVNAMTPGRGADYLGVENCCRVVMGDDPAPPFDKYSEELKDLKQVVWSIVGDCGSKRNDEQGDDLNELLRQAEKYPNITGGILDDFFKSDGAGRYDVEDVEKFRDRLHGFARRKLDLWIVLYELQLDFDLRRYLDLCDVITFWTWKGSNLKNLNENLAKVIERTPGKRRFAGCYMWNYGEAKPLTIDDMRCQCETYCEWMEKGELEGIIFCSNCIMDIGLDAVEWTKQWIKN